VPPRAVDIARLQAELVRQGVYLQVPRLAAPSVSVS
jgi:uncharacterized protein YcgL (UPF0745 family)